MDIRWAREGKDEHTETIVHIGKGCSDRDRHSLKQKRKYYEVAGEE